MGNLYYFHNRSAINTLSIKQGLKSRQVKQVITSTLNKIIETLTINPAKILQINKGTLKKGSDGDICILNLDAPWMVKAENLKSKSKNTAIEGRTLQGKVLMTFLNGELVFNQ